MTEYELSDGTLAVGVKLPIDPYGTALIVGQDTSPASKAILRELKASWAKLWPEMHRRLKDAMENLDIEFDFAEDEMTGIVSKTQPGKFMSDESDIYLSLSFGEEPEWVYFIRGREIVHFQPVF